MVLNDAPRNVNLVILEIKADLASKIKLLSMGIHVNDSIIKLNKSRRGPVLFRNISLNSTKMALGRSWARNIVVVPMEA